MWFGSPIRAQLADDSTHSISLVCRRSYVFRRPFSSENDISPADIVIAVTKASYELSRPSKVINASSPSSIIRPLSQTSSAFLEIATRYSLVVKSRFLQLVSSWHNWSWRDFDFTLNKSCSAFQTS